MAPPSAQALQRLADDTGHQPGTREKVLRLLDLLQEIARDRILSDRLVLKGGTALNLTLPRSDPCAASAPGTCSEGVRSRSGRARRDDVTDRRELPTYTISEAAHYLSVPAATIRYWSVGRGSYLPLIDVPSPGPPTLVSFLNLTELHVLSALRRKHQVKMPAVRKAIEYLSSLAETAIDRRHPLVSRTLETDGLHVFTDYYGQLINLSRSGQAEIREVIAGALERIERDPGGIPIKLYPFTRHSLTNAPILVLIDPALSGGRPVIAGTGLATQIIFERYKLGESISDLADDHERPSMEIEEAIRCELEAAA